MQDKKNNIRKQTSLQEEDLLGGGTTPSSNNISSWHICFAVLRGGLARDALHIT